MSRYLIAPHELDGDTQIQNICYLFSITCEEGSKEPQCRAVIVKS